jgi:hypothetical protein
MDLDLDLEGRGCVLLEILPAIWLVSNIASNIASHIEELGKC